MNVLLFIRSNSIHFAPTSILSILIHQVLEPIRKTLKINSFIEFFLLNFHYDPVSNKTTHYF